MVHTYPTLTGMTVKIERKTASFLFKAMTQSTKTDVVVVKGCQSNMKYTAMGQIQPYDRSKRCVIPFSDKVCWNYGSRANPNDNYTKCDYGTKTISLNYLRNCISSTMTGKY